MNVLVTGSSSHLARALLPLLCAQDHIEHVTGVDIATSHFKHEKFQAERCDIREPRLTELLKDQDALVHLAFVVLRGRMREAQMADINVSGSYGVFKAARNAGVKRLVHLSSAAVYGQGANVTEAAPLAALPGFLYGKHKARLERLLEAEFPECVRLRPHVILGPNAQPLLRTLLNLPLYLALPELHPCLQCVHEDDVARAVLLAIERDVRGPFNLAAEDSFSYRDLIKRRHRHALPLPQGVARAGLHAAWRLTGWGGEPAWIDGLANTLTLDCTRAQRELDWRSRHDSAQTYASTL
jgi:nucleoside-diphosphate-sugar epimerase